MGQFNKKLLENLALTVDPKDNNSMEVYGKLGDLGFNVDGLFDIKQFYHAVFKILMLRAVDQYNAKDLDSVDEKNRSVQVTLTMNLSSPVVHSNEQLVEQGIVGDLEAASKLRDVEPVVQSAPGDSPSVLSIISLINSGSIGLACT